MTAFWNLIIRAVSHLLTWGGICGLYCSQQAGGDLDVVFRPLTLHRDESKSKKFKQTSGEKTFWAKGGLFTIIIQLPRWYEILEARLSDAVISRSKWCIHGVLKVFISEFRLCSIKHLKAFSPFCEFHLGSIIYILSLYDHLAAVLPPTDRVMFVTHPPTSKINKSTDVFTLETTGATSCQISLWHTETHLLMFKTGFFSCQWRGKVEHATK